MADTYSSNIPLDTFKCLLYADSEVLGTYRRRWLSEAHVLALGRTCTQMLEAKGTDETATGPLGGEELLWRDRHWRPMRGRKPPHRVGDRESLGGRVSKTKGQEAAWSQVHSWRQEAGPARAAGILRRRMRDVRCGGCQGSAWALGPTAGVCCADHTSSSSSSSMVWGHLQLPSCTQPGLT